MRILPKKINIAEAQNKWLAAHLEHANQVIYDREGRVIGVTYLAPAYLWRDAIAPDGTVCVAGFDVSTIQTDPQVPAVRQQQHRRR